VVLHGPRVTLRPIATDDVDRLEAIRREPEVARWWGALEDDESGEWVGIPTWFAIEVGGQVVGAIQYSEEEEPMYRHAGIDLFLSASAHGHGLGSEAIRTLARYLIDERGHHRLTIDPATANHAAIRAYEKVGFTRVGVMRSYERWPDGTWHDGLLMELLAGELED
jgi:aminoglycoside 6'-N-acetyltransferase